MLCSAWSNDNLGNLYRLEMAHWGPETVNSETTAIRQLDALESPTRNTGSSSQDPKPQQSSMQFRNHRLVGLTLSVSLIMISTCLADRSDRETPLVKAVANCKSAVVNLRGRKTVRLDDSLATREKKQVNGMGTGVIIDSRGYILTNYHVVQDVKQIQVTTGSREKTVGRLIAHDPETDLALLKIDLPRKLPTIPLGTSSNLMLAETVAAVGNAYGYEHTVTVGIVSQLGRTVQVNDDQIYRNLIQTDAPINPGNSGGPLVNLDGEMIGINVAVRIGAQGIAFAIPVNDAMEIAAKLMEQYVFEEKNILHGIQATTEFKNDRPSLIVKAVESSSPAAEAGIESGDVIQQINGVPTYRSLDLHTSLIALAPTDRLELEVQQNGKLQAVSVDLAKQKGANTNHNAWKMLGMTLRPATDQEMNDLHPSYQHGLKVTRVRDAGPAFGQGIVEGDILVAMHGWKTESMDNLQYILEQPDIRNKKNFMFYVLREKERYWGELRVASQQ